MALPSQRGPIVATVICFLVPTIFVACRLHCRRFFDKGLWNTSDYLIIAALLCNYGLNSTSILLLEYGLGKPISTVSPEDLEMYLKVIFAGAFVYPITVALIKLSILALYHNLFEPSRFVRHGTLYLAVAIACWCLAAALAQTFLCSPVEKSWLPEVPGTCGSQADFFVGLQIPNLLTDLAILTLPLPVIWNLQMTTKRKYLLIGVFGMGALTVAIDCVRTAVLFQLALSSNDITLDQVSASQWTAYEPATGIVVACLPLLAPLLERFKGWVSLSHSKSSSSAERSSSSAQRSQLSIERKMELQKDGINVREEYSVTSLPDISRGSMLKVPGRV